MKQTKGQGCVTTGTLRKVNAFRKTLLGTADDTSPLDAKLATNHETFLAERPPGAEEDVHMVSAIVDHIIDRCSKPGDLVFDPFAGFGTTLIRAVALGREAMGIELLPERVDYLLEHIPNAHIIEGDARELLRLLWSPDAPLPHANIDLIIASPPYMTAENHEPDPLTAYEKNDGNYDRYLTELGLVADQCARVVAPGGYVVWNLADIHHMDLTTHLIRDCAKVFEQFLTPVGVTEILWDQYPHDLVADALLVFQRPHQ